MERTPSPPRRVHTPPAPLLGAKYDNYEPYSPPRRSVRVAAQRAQHSQHASPTHSRRPRAARETTPTLSKQKKVRTLGQALSPPSSPSSPYKRNSPRSTRRVHLEPHTGDSDSDRVAPTPARRLLSTMQPRGLLPTPAKTPRKRPLQSQADLGPTARVLFSNRPASLEDSLPTPRKRKNINDIYTLESFENQAEDDPQIQIYTDSKERVPELDEDEDNPFVSRKGKGKGKAKSNGTVKEPKMDEKTAKMHESVTRGEGMIYTFRGRKILRRFEDDPSHRSDEGIELSDDEVRRRVGHGAHRPLTRSSVKPRRLFEAEIQQQRAQAASQEDIDEEAPTDIEIHVTTPSRKSRKVDVQTTTPPPTTHKRGKHLDVGEVGVEEEPVFMKDPREISFGSWRRVKMSGSRASSSKKREGEPLESAADKRPRTTN